MCNVINFRSSASLIGSARSCTDKFLRFLVLEAIVFHVYKACVFTQNARQVSSLLEIMSLLFTRITTGNPVVFQGYLYSYPSKPTPTVEGMGFLWVRVRVFVGPTGHCRSQYPLWVQYKADYEY